MAITLGRPKTDGWIQLYDGGALHVRPADTTIVQIAQARADSLIEELADAGVAVTKAGGTIVDLPDLSDDSSKEGVRRALFILSLAEIAVDDWRNILDENGHAIPFKAAQLATLFTDPLVSQAFLPRYLAGAYEEIEAGNG